MANAIQLDIHLSFAATNFIAAIEVAVTTPHTYFNSAFTSSINTWPVRLLQFDPKSSPFPTIAHFYKALADFPS